MAIISLPVFGDHTPVAAAIQAMRHSHTGGVVSAGPSGFRLHRFENLIAVARQDSALPLGQVPGRDVDELEPREAHRSNLSFTRPDMGIIGPYLTAHHQDFLLMGAMQGQPGTALIAFRSDAEAQYYGAYPKAWVCPRDSNEVWDDNNKPALCGVHGVAPVEDK